MSGVVSDPQVDIFCLRCCLRAFPVGSLIALKPVNYCTDLQFSVAVSGLKAQLARQPEDD